VAQAVKPAEPSFDSAFLLFRGRFSQGPLP
jgi:hypothetical protein